MRMLREACKLEERIFDVMFGVKRDGNVEVVLNSDVLNLGTGFCA